MSECAEYEDYQEYCEYGGPEGIDSYNYWIDEMADAKSIEEEMKYYYCYEEPNYGL